MAKTNKNASSASGTIEVPTTETPAQAEEVKEQKPTASVTENTTEKKGKLTKKASIFDGIKLKTEVDAPNESIIRNRRETRALIDTFKVEGVEIGVAAPVKLYRNREGVKIEDINWDFYFHTGFGRGKIHIGDYASAGSIGLLPHFLSYEDPEGTSCVCLMVDQGATDLQRMLDEMRDSSLPQHRRAFKSLAEILVEYSAFDFEGDTHAAKVATATRMVREATQGVREYAELPDALIEVIQHFLSLRFAARVVEHYIEYRHGLTRPERVQIDNLISANGLTDIDFNLDTNSVDGQNMLDLTTYAKKSANKVLETSKVDGILNVLKGIRDIKLNSAMLDASLYQKSATVKKYQFMITDNDLNLSKKDLKAAREVDFDAQAAEKGLGIQLPKSK